MDTLDIILSGILADLNQLWWDKGQEIVEHFYLHSSCIHVMCQYIFNPLYKCHNGVWWWWHGHIWLIGWYCEPWIVNLLNMINMLLMMMMWRNKMFYPSPHIIWTIIQRTGAKLNQDHFSNDSLICTNQIKRPKSRIQKGLPFIEER